MVNDSEPVSEREVIVARTIAAPRERVFEAWTAEHHLARWFGPNGFSTITRSFDFREGGIWDFTLRGPDGADFPNLVQWREINPPELIRYVQGTDAENPDVFESTVTFRTVAEGTELTIRSVFKTRALRDEAIEKFGAIEGGHQTLGRLAEYLGSASDRNRPARRLIIWNLQSLDGCFEGPSPWALDFHTTVWGDELREFSISQLGEVGILLFGRATYEGMASHWSEATDEIADLMNAIPKIVFSSTLTSADWNNTTLVNDDAADAIRRLKAEPGRDLFIFGSARLCDSLMRQGLIDEYRICIAPVILREGPPLFKPGGPSHHLHLLECRPLSTGGLLLRYAPQ